MGYTTLRDETLPRLRRTLDALIAHTEDTKARTIAASQYVQSHKPHAAEMYHPEYQKVVCLSLSFSRVPPNSSFCLFFFLFI